MCFGHPEEYPVHNLKEHELPPSQPICRKALHGKQAPCSTYPSSRDLFSISSPDLTTLPTNTDISSLFLFGPHRLYDSASPLTLSSLSTTHHPPNQYRNPPPPPHQNRPRYNPCLLTSLNPPTPKPSLISSSSSSSFVLKTDIV